MVGKKLTCKLLKEGYAVTIISRSLPSEKPIGELTFATWKAVDQVINDAYGVVNLSGASIVGKRWSEEYKKVLTSSRIETTKKIVAAIKKAPKKPKVLVNASAIGYYGILPKAYGFTESDPAGMDFLAQLCVGWEKEATFAEEFGTRVVCIRSAIILDKSEGALPQMLLPFRLFFGGPIGSGAQPLPWIHIDDEVNIFFTALENTHYKGAINAVSPEKISQKAFSNVLGTVLRRPSWIPVPPFVLRWLYGEGSSVITSGVVVSPKKLEALGFEFAYPNLQFALENLL